MKILQANFLYSVPSIDLLKPHNPSVVFLGRSNVGKSSFINTFSRRKDLAKTSKSPGQTRHAVVYEVLYQKGVKEKKLFLLDLPGYGYAKMSKVEATKSEELIDSILNEYESISLICLLLDARRALDDREKTIIAIANQRQLPYLVILTKADKLNQQERLLASKRVIEELSLPKERVIFHSNLDTKLAQEAIHNIFQFF